MSDASSEAFPIIDGSLIPSVSAEWDIGFPAAWSNETPERTVMGIMPGTFGNPIFPRVVGGNFSFVHVALSPSISTTTVSIPAPLLGNPETPAGVYTLFVQELPETKFVCEDVEPFECSDVPYTDQDFIDFMTTDPNQPDAPFTYPPLGGRSLAFEYIAGGAPNVCENDCFSNVLFIPGIKATELYEGSSKRWLPGLFGIDASRMEMDATGESINNLTVGGPIRKAYQLVEVYGNFFDFLDNLKSTNAIIDWKSAPYDWRYDVYDVVSHDQQMHDGSVQNLVNQIYELAATSKTGKVSIISHSNGGLVGKALIDALGDDANLVDKFIVVGTPQLGTPSAISAMLHGTGQGLPIDAAPFAMSKANSRDLSENMPGAYGLLPLAEYFNAVTDPVVEFDNSAFSTPYRNAYGDSIDSASKLYSFLLGTGDGRTKPDSDDTLTPTILNSALLSDTLITRNTLESWTPPSGTEVVQVAGWGLDTMRGFRYDERMCSPGCGTFLDIKPLMTVEGDATVVSPSASAMNDETYYFNMASFNYANETTWSHANILAAVSVQDLLVDIIKDEPRAASYITTTKPTAADAGKRLHLSVHSPVTIGIRDSQGRFTGVTPNPDPSSDIPVVLQEIPNTYYFEFGEGKYVGFGANEHYNVVMQGTGNGTFTLEVEETNNDEVTDTATYSDVPVSTETIAELNIQDLQNKGALEVDENGDGTVDETFQPDGESSLNDLLANFKAQISSLSIKDKLKQNLLKKIDTLEKRIAGKKLKNAKVLANFKTKITNQEVKGKTDAAGAGDITALLELLEAQYDDVVLDAVILTQLKEKVLSLNIKVNFKNDLLKRVARLENKHALTHLLENLTHTISKKALSGKIPDADAQALLDLLTQIESAL